VRDDFDFSLSICAFQLKRLGAGDDVFFSQDRRSVMVVISTVLVVRMDIEFVRARVPVAAA